MCDGLRDERVLGCEMAVKPAVRRADGLHEGGNAYTMDPSFLEARARGLDDFLAHASFMLE